MRNDAGFTQVKPKHPRDAGFELVQPEHCVAKVGRPKGSKDRHKRKARR